MRYSGGRLLKHFHTLGCRHVDCSRGLVGKLSKVLRYCGIFMIWKTKLPRYVGSVYKPVWMIGQLDHCSGVVPGMRFSLMANSSIRNDAVQRRLSIRWNSAFQPRKQCCNPLSRVKDHEVIYECWDRLNLIKEPAAISGRNPHNLAGTVFAIKDFVKA